MRLLLALVTQLCLCVVSCSGGIIFGKRADGKLKVLSPRGGDRFSTGIDVGIKWDTSEASEVNLELRKGAPENLTTVHIISSGTPNNGSYLWRSEDDYFLKALSSSELPRTPPSGCDYLLTVRDQTNSASSQYFTIINLNDKGLKTDAKCPAASDAPGSSGNAPIDGDSQSAGGESASQDGTAASTSSIGAGTLGGAVGGTAAGLIFIFGLILFLGRSRGWFVSRDFIKQQVAVALVELKPGLSVSGMEHGSGAAQAQGEQSREISSRNIYQMPGSETEK